MRGSAARSLAEGSVRMRRRSDAATACVMAASPDRSNPSIFESASDGSAGFVTVPGEPAGIAAGARRAPLCLGPSERENAKNASAANTRPAAARRGIVPFMAAMLSDRPAYGVRGNGLHGI